MTDVGLLKWRIAVYERSSQLAEVFDEFARTVEEKVSEASA